MCVFHVDLFFICLGNTWKDFLLVSIYLVGVHGGNGSYFVIGRLQDDDKELQLNCFFASFLDISWIFLLYLPFFFFFPSFFHFE